MFTNEFLGAIKSLNISDVASSLGLPLTQKGANHKAICPFHGDKNASLSFSNIRGIYTCFACGATGDVIKFVMEYCNMTLPEAVLKISEVKGLKPEYQINNNQSKTNTQLIENIKYANTKIAQSYAEQLNNSEQAWAAKKYLLNARNFTPSTIEQWQIGYAPNDQKFTQQALQQAQPETIAASALNNKHGNSFFSDRITFPIHHHSTGKVLGFTARVYRPDQQNNPKTPKYINTPETPVFNKSTVLFGLYQVLKKYKNKVPQILIVEGATDAIMLHQTNIDYAVASLGTSLTAKQVQIIARYTDTVLLMTDPDKAGIAAADRYAVECLKANLHVKWLQLPDKQDPDKFCQQHPSPKQYIEQNAKDFILEKARIIADALQKTNNNPQHIARAAQNLQKTIDAIAMPITKQIYFKEVEQITGIKFYIEATEPQHPPQKQNLPDGTTTGQKTFEKIFIKKYNDAIYFAIANLHAGEHTLQDNITYPIGYLLFRTLALNSNYHTTETEPIIEYIKKHMNNNKKEYTLQEFKNYLMYVVNEIITNPDFEQQSQEIKEIIFNKAKPKTNEDLKNIAKETIEYIETIYKKSQIQYKLLCQIA